MRSNERFSMEIISNLSLLYPDDETAFVRTCILAKTTAIPAGLENVCIVPIEANTEIWWVVSSDTPREEISDMRRRISIDCTFVSIGDDLFAELFRKYKAE